MIDNLDKTKDETWKYTGNEEKNSVIIFVFIDYLRNSFQILY